VSLTGTLAIEVKAHLILSAKFSGHSPGFQGLGHGHIFLGLPPCLLHFCHIHPLQTASCHTHLFERGLSIACEAANVDIGAPIRQ
jgi:hypothetical protein